MAHLRRPGVALVLLLVLAAVSARSDHDPQPANRKSFVVARDGSRITDVRLAAALRNNLPNQDVARVNSVELLVYACSSGGFIDDFVGLGGVISVATSSKHNEVTQNTFGRTWMEVFLGSTDFVESKKTFDEARRLTTGPQGTPQYHSTGGAGDRIVPGAGYFGTDGLVTAKTLKVLMWVGQEVESRNDPDRFEQVSDWGQLKAVKEITNVTGVKIESRLFYDNLEPGRYRYSAQHRGFVELTEEEVEKLPEDEKKEVIKVDGKGSADNLLDTLAAFAKASDPATQIFIFLGSHGKSKVKPQNNPGDPVLDPGVALDDLLLVDDDVLDGMLDPLLQFDTSGIETLQNAVLFNGVRVGGLLPSVPTGGRSEVFLGVPPAVGVNTLTISCDQATPCQFDNMGLVPRGGLCPNPPGCVTQLIGPDGGLVTDAPPILEVASPLPLPGAAVEIPPGALDGPVPITLCRQPLAAHPVLPPERHLARQGLGLSTFSVEIRPFGLELALPATVHLGYTDEQIGGLLQESLAPRRFEGNVGAYEVTRIAAVEHDPILRTVLFETDRLGPYTLVGTTGPNPQRPVVTVRLNRDVFATDEELRLGLAGGNPGEPTAVDAYLGAILPDGERIAFVSGLATRSVAVTPLDEPASFIPLVEGVTLPAGFDAVLPSLLRATLGKGIPTGIYTAVAALTRPGSLADGSIDPGDVLSAHFVDFSLDPGTSAAATSSR